MPDQSTINLNDILREERKSRLVSLAVDFYEKAAEQILRLEMEKRNIEDSYGTKYAHIEDELKTSRKAISNIIERRTAKIIKEASLRASAKQREKQDLESLTKEERRFYSSLLTLMTEWRGGLLDQILTVPKENRQTEAKTEDIVLGIQKPSIPEEASLEPELTANSGKEGKKDINKDYLVVRLLKDIPTFVGFDGCNYSLAKEDLAVLPTVNAKALISKNAAVQIPVKR
jgi:DNA replication factor GINS